MRWHESRAAVRFHEADAYNILWHGNYASYFEIGRLDFCAEFGLSVDEMTALGYFSPVIELHCRFRESARYGDEIIIRTGIDPSDKALLTFRYELDRASDGRLLCEGSTTHVLLSLKGTMQFIVPPDLQRILDRMQAYCHGG